MDSEVVEALSRSKAGLRWFYPVIKAKDGTILDGLHRQAADPGWKAVTLQEIDSEEKKVLAKVACNFVRREVPAEEKAEMLGSLAKLGWDAKRISDETGLALSTVYKYLPDEAKQEAKAEAGKAGGDAKSATRRVAQRQELSSERQKEQEVAESELDLKKAGRRGPYAKGLSPSAREGLKPQYTEQHMILAAAFNKVGLFPDVEKPFVREGEFTKDGKPKEYFADLHFGEQKVIVEVEGEGSASADNDERELFFTENGYQVVHVPNACARSHGHILAAVVRAFIRKEA